MRISREPRARTRSITAVVVLAGALVATNVSGLGAQAAPKAAAADPAVITAWNATTVATVVTDAGKASPEAFLFFAYQQAAVYNAVVGITREYELYKWHKHGPRGASPEAAAAAAAHRLLLNYFPASQSRLDTALASSLARVPDGHAKDQGVRYGERAADRMIELRTDDGRNASVTYNVAPAPGVWRPTPTAFAPFALPWLSQVRPLMISSPDQFRPAPPPAMSSATYAQEFDEVKAYGVKTGSLRTPDQTQTAMLFSDISFGPLQAALRDVATRRRLDISDSARLFAAADMSIADGAVAVWDSKLHYALWRPITAIHEAADDGNPATVPQGDWQPLINNPPYPDYASGLSSVVCALSRAVTRVLGDGRVDLNITSVAAGLPGPPLTRHYDFAADLDRDVIDARVWLGIHFRSADVAGGQIGTSVANWALDHYFQPTA